MPISICRRGRELRPLLVLPLMNGPPTVIYVASQGAAGLRTASTDIGTSNCYCGARNANPASRPTGAGLASRVRAAEDSRSPCPPSPRPRQHANPWTTDSELPRSTGPLATRRVPPAGSFRDEGGAGDGARSRPAQPLSKAACPAIPPRGDRYALGFARMGAGSKKGKWLEQFTLGRIFCR